MLGKIEKPLYPPIFLADLTLKTLDVLKEQMPAETYHVVESLVIMNTEQNRNEATDQFLQETVSELLWYTSEETPSETLKLEMRLPA